MAPERSEAASRNAQEAPARTTAVSEDLHTAVESFLGDADTVFAEYEQGYMDADAALSRIEASLGELRDAHDAADEE